MQVPGVAPVFRPWSKAGAEAPLLVGVEGQVQADGVIDAADETHAGEGQTADNPPLSHRP
jgi:hypothetical protein